MEGLSHDQDILFLSFFSIPLPSIFTTSLMLGCEIRYQFPPETNAKTMEMCECDLSM